MKNDKETTKDRDVNEFTSATDNMVWVSYEIETQVEPGGETCLIIE
jgi:hypothetical protein